MEAEMGLKINFPDHIIGGFWADGFWPSGTTPLSWMTPLKDTGSWEGESRLGVSQKSVAKSGDVWPQIARLTDHPQKWACTFWNHQKVQVYFNGISVNWAIVDQILSIFSQIFKFCIFMDFGNFADISVLFGIVRPRWFQKVQAHFCRWSVSSAIPDQTSADFATNFRETPNFQGGARG